MKIYILLATLSFLSLLTQAQNKLPSDSTRSKVIDTLRTFTKVEVESEFPGGMPEWQRFLQKHLKYPGKAIRKGIQGEVVLQFVVCTDGSVCDIQAISGPEELKASAIQALENTPNWIPATQDGVKVKSYKKQAIIYNLGR